MKIKPFRADAPTTVSTVNPQRQPVSAPPQQVANPTMVVKSTVAAPAIKPSAENRGKIFSSPDFVSIKALAGATAQEAAKVEEQNVIDAGPIREFTIDEFREIWSNYAHHQLAHNMQAQTAFKVAALEKVGERTIRVAFPSETAIMFFTDVRVAFSEFLRNERSLPGVEFELDTLKHNEIRLSTKSDKEKFEAMREKNPALEELRKKFNLQIDF